MLQITRGASNTIICTLREKQTLANPYFLFRFISEGGMNVEQTAILTDTSSYNDRYNKFTFTEGTDITLTSGIWEYRVYEQSSASNTNYINATTELEVGLAQVDGTDNVTFKQGTSSDTFVWTN